MIEKVLSQVQAAEIGLLRGVHGVTLRDKVRSCKTRKALNVDPFFLRNKESQSRCSGYVIGMS